MFSFGNTCVAKALGTVLAAYLMGEKLKGDNVVTTANPGIIISKYNPSGKICSWGIIFSGLNTCIRFQEELRSDST